MPLLAVLGFWIADRSDATDQPAPATEVLLDRPLGLRVGYPPTWDRQRQRGAHRLVSADGSITVLVSSPTRGYFPSLAARDNAQALLRAYRPARIVGRAPGTLAGRRVITTELAATSREGRPVRILSIAAASRFRTYTVTVFSAVPPPAPRFLEAQSILRAVTFFKPRPKTPQR